LVRKSERVPIDRDGVAYGPAMQALTERRRRFVEAMFEVKPGRGAPVRAARRAGYGSPTSTMNAMAVIAHRLVHDPRVQAALFEIGRARLHSLAPQALYAVARLIENPEHRDHARALGMVLDRTHMIETRHEVLVRRDPEPIVQATERVLARIAELARAAGIDDRRLPKLIDVTPTAEEAAS
jgi:phage terminase small subunit